MEEQEKKTFKILSIDGGGIKGLYSSTILEILEERYNCKSYEYFDMLCGTSTGGLIALALSAGKSAKDISKMCSSRFKYLLLNAQKKCSDYLFTALFNSGRIISWTFCWELSRRVL